MKKSIIILSSLFFLMSCGSGTETKETTTEDTAAAAPAAPAPDPEAQKGLDLVAQSDCFTCHKLNESSIGPSYAAVAEKYSTHDRKEAIDSISYQIIHGGVGKWGTTQMQAHPAVTPEEAGAMAAYVLSIKKD